MKSLVTCFFLTIFALALNDWSFSVAQENLVTIHDAVVPIREVYWSADGEIVVSVSDDRLEAWDVNTGEKVAETTEPLFVDIPLAYYSTKGQRIAWTSDGDFASVVNPEENTVSVYEWGNDTPLYTIAGDEDEWLKMSAVLWRSDGRVWVPEYGSGSVSLSRQRAITFYRTSDGVITGQITVDTDEFLDVTYYSSLSFELGGDDLSFVHAKQNIFEVSIVDSNTLEVEVILSQDFSPPVSVRWITSQIFRIGDLYRDYLYNLETDTQTPYLGRPIDPNQLYYFSLTNQAELQVVQTITDEVVDTLVLTDFVETDADTLLEVTRFSESPYGIVIYRGIPLTIWRPELPD